jgi:CRISPR/Cas system-associated exonuclease Cas4 (RecB family)
MASSGGYVIDVSKIRPWSNSRLGTFEDCPKKFWFQYVQHTPKGKKPESPAMNRGSDIHTKAEKYLTGELKLYPPEIQKVSGHAMMLKSKKAKAEQLFAVNDKWLPCGFDADDAYFRSIIDVLYVDKMTVHIQDWKTGQPYDYHVPQLEQYTAIVAAHFPAATRFESRLIYTDQGIVTKPKVTEVGRIKGIRIMLDAQIQNVETATEFPTKPGMQCRWCEYSTKYGGPCEY